MHYRPRTPLRVGAAAGALTLLMHGVLALLLMLEDRDMQRPLPAARRLTGMWIHLTPPSLPESEAPVDPARADAPSEVPAAPRPRTAITLAPAPTVAPDSAPEAAVATSPESRPPTDWELEAQKRAGPFGPDDPETFSPPPETTREACKPHQSSMWPKKPEQVDAPPSWQDNFKPPPGSVVLGGRRVGVVGIGIPIGGQKPEPNSHLFDDMMAGKTPRSSVPDPHVCD
jgi:hypothetical protein